MRDLLIYLATEFAWIFEEMRAQIVGSDPDPKWDGGYVDVQTALLRVRFSYGRGEYAVALRPNDADKSLILTPTSVYDMLDPSPSTDTLPTESWGSYLRSALPQLEENWPDREWRENALERVKTSRRRRSS